MSLAGPECAPPAKEIVKIFVKGLSPSSLQTEIRCRNFETLEQALEECADVVVKYKAIFDLQASMNKRPSKKEKQLSDKKKPVDVDPGSAGDTVPEKSSKVEKSVNLRDKSSITCYKCLKKGHLASQVAIIESILTQLGRSAKLDLCGQVQNQRQNQLLSPSLAQFVCSQLIYRIQGMILLEFLQKSW